jgi:ribosomal protein S18 acetylase RimI-like enzyme
MPTLSKIEHTVASEKAKLMDFLSARETHNLFILGNLQRGFPGTHLYAASREGRWCGVAAYFEMPKSLCLFSEDPEVVRALVRHVASLHRPIRFVNAIDYVAEPACEEMGTLGYRLQRDPHQVFMETPVPNREAWLPREGLDKVRLVRDSDGPAVARLVRYISRPTDDSPLAEDEIARAILNPLRHVLEIEGRIASTASTNGLGLTAFQILGVATLPEYRRRGYASVVCAALMRTMRGQGARSCVLFTGVDNVSAQRCYEKLGFRATGGYYVAEFAAEAAPSPA